MWLCLYEIVCPVCPAVRLWKRIWSWRQFPLHYMSPCMIEKNVTMFYFVFSLWKKWTSITRWVSASWGKGAKGWTFSGRCGRETDVILYSGYQMSLLMSLFQTIDNNGLLPEWKWWEDETQDSTLWEDKEKPLHCLYTVDTTINHKKVKLWWENKRWRNLQQTPVCFFRTNRRSSSLRSHSCWLVGCTVGTGSLWLSVSNVFWLKL